MKANLSHLFIGLAMFAGIHPAAAQGTAFTYQGRLNDGVNVANGSYDLQFTLFNTNQFGFPASPILTNAAVTITNGLFTTTLDFGPGVFTGTSCWLDISVRTNGNGNFTELSPRQPIAPTPYAITAENLSGVVENNNTIQNGVLLGTISGGGGNVIRSGANNATIGGGGPNSIGTNSFVATISGGANNVIGANDDTSTIGGGNVNIIQDGAGVSTIAGGVGNQIHTGSPRSTISGGSDNHILTNSEHSTIGGGGGNQIQNNSSYSTIAGGDGNNIYVNDSSIGGGANNTIQTNADHSAIGGGWFNGIGLNDYEGVIAGGFVNSIGDLSGYSFIGGGQYNSIGTNSPNSTIAGGRENQIQTNDFGATIGGGYLNQIQTNAVDSTIGGGYNNQIQSGAFVSSIGGGGYNQIQPGAYYATIAGGDNNIIGTNSAESTIGGGYNNTIETNSSYSTIGGGYGNTILTNSPYSTVPGGGFNLAGGGYSFAAGYRAQALHQGAFVWADSQNATFASTRNDQFSIRAAGGVVINVSGSAGLNPAAVTISSTSVNGIGLLVNESSSDTATLFANNGIGDIVKGFHNGNTVFEVKYDGTVISKGMTLTSDRNAKEHFAALDGKSILAKVISLPVTEWNYKDDTSDKKHIGPMAQDFHEAFQLDGADDKHISVVDEGGVALAAIQGLNQKVEEKDAEIQALKQSVDELKGIVKQLAEKK